MRNFIIALLVFSIILNGCGHGIHVAAVPRTLPKDNVKLAEINAIIIIPKKLETKTYQFAGKSVHLYPGFTESISSEFSNMLNEVTIIKESEFDASKYRGQVVIKPNWEIETGNLHIGLQVSNLKSGRDVYLDSSVPIEKRSELRAFLYIMSIFTIVGLPISLYVDQNDITHKVETAMAKLVIELKLALDKELKKDDQLASGI